MSTLPFWSPRAPSPALLRFLKDQSAFKPRICPRSFSPHNVRLRQARSGSTIAKSAIRSPCQSRIENRQCAALNDHGWPHSKLFTAFSPLQLSDSRTQRHGRLARTISGFRFTQTRCISLWDWKFNDKKKSNPLQPDDLPPLASFLGDPSSFERFLKPSNELILKCTELDENGRVTLMDGEFKKTELIAKVSLLHTCAVS
jgi:hypothetical protein